MQSQEACFTINICSAQTQEDGINECGTLAIAFAVEFLITGNLRNHTFDIARLRQHLELCILNGKMTPFPKVCQNALPIKIKEKHVVEVYCCCRRPGWCDQMVYCSKCKKWLFFSCENLDSKPQERHYECSSCRFSKNKK